MFRKQTGSWYVQFRGKQYPLGNDRDAAWIKYHQLMGGEKELAPATPAAVDNYLEWVSFIRAPATYESYKRHLASFAKYIGARMRVADLKPYRVIRWVDRDYKGQAYQSPVF